MTVNSENIKKRLFDSDFGISESFADKMAKRLMNCVEALQPNVSEWLEGKPFSDIYIRDKYCLNMVLKIRGNPASVYDIARAILALNAYAEDEKREFLIWEKRM